MHTSHTDGEQPTCLCGVYMEYKLLYIKSHQLLSPTLCMVATSTVLKDTLDKQVSPVSQHRALTHTHTQIIAAAALQRAHLAGHHIDERLILSVRQTTDVMACKKGRRMKIRYKLQYCCYLYSNDEETAQPRNGQQQHHRDAAHLSRHYKYTFYE